MSARDINSRLVIHAKVFSLSALPALNLFNKKRSQHESHSDYGEPHEPCLKIQHKMSSSYIWSSLYKCLTLWNLGATFRIVFLGHLWNQEKMLLRVAFSEPVACSWFKKTRQMPLVLAGFTQWMFLTLACDAYLWNQRISQWQNGECHQIGQTQKRPTWWVHKIPVQPGLYPHTTHITH